VKVKHAEVRRRVYVEGSVFEKVLPKGFYGVEIWKKGYEAVVVFRVPPFRDAEVPVLLFRGRDVDDRRIIRP